MLIEVNRLLLTVFERHFSSIFTLESQQTVRETWTNSLSKYPYSYYTPDKRIKCLSPRITNSSRTLFPQR